MLVSRAGPGCKEPEMSKTVHAHSPVQPNSAAAPGKEKHPLLGVAQGVLSSSWM